MNDMLIRKATAAEAQSIFDIRIAAINYRCKGHYPPRDLEIWTAGIMSAQFVQMVEDKAYVATAGNFVLGTGMINLESGQVDAVFVRPSFMDRGVGRQMMSCLERLAIQAGLSQLKLDATLNAVRFYRAVGFVGDAIAKYESTSGVSLECIPMLKDLPVSK